MKVASLGTRKILFILIGAGNGVMIYLDTHIVVWLYLGDPSRFSATAQKALNEHDLKISPLVVLELTYLYEIGRVLVTADPIMESLSNAVGLGTRHNLIPPKKITGLTAKIEIESS